MTLEIKANKNLFRSINITIPNDIIQKSIKEELIILNNTTHINGFRKGKVPLHILNKKYENKIQESVLKKLMQKHFLNEIRQKNFNIAGEPTFILHQYEKEKDLNYSIEFEIYPKFKINIKECTVNIPVINITEQDIKKYARDFLKQNTWIEVNNTIKLHDKVTITCIHHTINQDLSKYNLYNFQFIIGNNEILPEIEKEILNHKTNESFLINVKFSKNHYETDIAGKTARIKIIIKKVEKLKPILFKSKNDELNLNQKQYDIVKIMLQKQAQIIIKNYIKSQIIKHLIKSNPIDIPSTLIKNTFSILKKKEINTYKKNKKNVFRTIHQKNLISKARHQVFTTILLRQFIQENSLKPDYKKIILLIQEMSKSHNQTTKLINLYNNNTNIKQYFENIDLENQVVSKILEKSIKHKNNYSFYEAINELNNINI
ncbi:MAG: trigger factor [Buchnera aphidicola (Melaphis rhois)]